MLIAQPIRKMPFAPEERKVIMRGVHMFRSSGAVILFGGAAVL